jgi:predicted amidohydrolase
MPIIAAIQMCSSDKVEDNLKTAERLIVEAAKNNAELVVLPEMFAIMGKKDTDKIAVKEKFGIGKIQDFLSNTAKKYNVWIVGGTIPLESTSENKVFASSLVYDNQGKCIARYDKIHLFDVTLPSGEKYQESTSTEAGDHITVIDTPFGKLAVVVCYDLRFPLLFQVLREKGVDIIAVPTAFTEKTGKDHFHTLVKARALDTFSFVIASCQYGEHASGRKTYGHSMMVGPWGNTLDEISENKEGIVYATLDLNEIQKVRQSIPTHLHTRKDL